MSRFLDSCERVSKLFEDCDFDEIIFSDAELNDPVLKGLSHNAGHPSDETKFICLEDEEEYEEW